MGNKSFKISIICLLFVVVFCAKAQAFSLNCLAPRLQINQQIFLENVNINKSLNINWGVQIEPWVKSQLLNAQRRERFIERVVAKILNKTDNAIEIYAVNVSLFNRGKKNKFSYRIKVDLITGERIEFILKSYKYNRSVRFEREVESLALLGPEHVALLYGYWTHTPTCNKNEQLDENNYMFFAQSYELGATLQEYLDSLPKLITGIHKSDIKDVLSLAINRYARVQKITQGYFQLTNTNPNNIIINILTSGKIVVKIIDTGGQIQGYDHERWCANIMQNLVNPVQLSRPELRGLLDIQEIKNITHDILDQEFTFLIPDKKLTKKRYLSHKEFSAVQLLNSAI
ncbi:MAG: hypothetical protein ABIG64_04795 [Candidatus Omnitrophota bacterium]